MIKFHDLYDIKWDDELFEYLTNYEGVLPKYLLFFINVLEYDENLKNKGLYDDVYKEYYTIRMNRLHAKDKDEFDDNELNVWLNENPKFIELINEDIF